MSSLCSGVLGMCGKNATEQCQCDSVRYGKQYQYFQQIIAVYESEPDNFARLSELMQEMQETGQPPSEIVKDLAPGLQFDDEGNPVMPNMVQQTDFLCMLTMLVANRLTDLGSVLCVCLQGAGMFPGMAGMPGMPSESLYLSELDKPTHHDI